MPRQKCRSLHFYLVGALFAIGFFIVEASRAQTSPRRQPPESGGQGGAARLDTSCASAWILAGTIVEVMAASELAGRPG